MATRTNRLVGLDIGTGAVKVVVADVSPDGRIEVVGMGTSPSRGLRKGVVINIEATVDSISRALSQAENMAGSEISSVVAAISGSHIKGFNSHGIVGVKNREVSQYDIDRVLEAAKAVAIPLDREVLHVLPQEYIIDEQDGIREPIGISGVRLEARVHVVTGAVASAQNIVKCANRCGLSVQDIALAGLATAKSVLSAEEQELGVCLVDIGAGTADVAVYHSGAVKHTAVISVGGNHITADIAAGLRTPLAGAETIKCQSGTAMASLGAPEETVEVPSTGGRAPRVLTKDILAEIIEPRVHEIFTLIQRELVRSGADELLTSGLVLTGGTAKLRGIAAVAEQVFNLPVRVGAPMVGSFAAEPEFATAIGLVQSSAHATSRRRFSQGKTGFGRVMKRVANWFGEHF